MGTNDDVRYVDVDQNLDACGYGLRSDGGD